MGQGDQTEFLATGKQKGEERKGEQKGRATQEQGPRTRQGKRGGTADGTEAEGEKNR